MERKRNVVAGRGIAVRRQPGDLDSILGRSGRRARPRPRPDVKTRLDLRPLGIQDAHSEVLPPKASDRGAKDLSLPGADEKCINVVAVQGAKQLCRLKPLQKRHAPLRQPVWRRRFAAGDHARDLESRPAGRQHPRSDRDAIGVICGASFTLGRAPLVVTWASRLLVKIVSPADEGRRVWHGNRKILERNERALHQRATARVWHRRPSHVPRKSAMPCRRCGGLSEDANVTAERRATNLSITTSCSATYLLDCQKTMGSMMMSKSRNRSSPSLRCSWCLRAPESATLGGGESTVRPTAFKCGGAHAHHALDAATMYPFCVWDFVREYVAFRCCLRHRVAKRGKPDLCSFSVCVRSLPAGARLRPRSLPGPATIQDA